MLRWRIGIRPAALATVGGLGLILLVSGDMAMPRDGVAKEMLPVVAAQTQAGHAFPKARLASSFRSMPLLFVRNEGQLGDGVLYALQAGSSRVDFLATEIRYSFVRQEAADEGAAAGPKKRLAGPVKVESLRLIFEGAKAGARLLGLDRSETKVNAFLGNDPDAWRTDIPAFRRIVYEDLYPALDLIVDGANGVLKLEYRLKPGGDPAAVGLRYEGARTLRVAPDGALEVETAGGVLREDAPACFQVIDGEKVGVNAGYILRDEKRAGFRVGDFDRTRGLVIDPALYFSTLLGGSSEEAIVDIVLDAAGYIYATGWTMSSNFPTVAAGDTTFNGDVYDVFVARFNPLATSLVYATYLGGGRNDYGEAMAVDSAGNMFITGFTNSTNFPVSGGAFDTTWNGDEDVFVTKINASGVTLAYSTYIGGSGEDDDAWDMAVDSAGNAYICGQAGTTNFPTTFGAYDRVLSGGSEAFVLKLNAAGSALTYSTFLGGATGGDTAQAISIDSGGNAYVAGYTYCTDFPTTTGAFDRTFNGIYDQFVTKLNAAGTGLVYSTFLGGDKYDNAYEVGVDSAGNAFVAGWTGSSDYPTTSGAFDRTLSGSGDAVLVKLNATGSALVYSTLIGGSSSDYIFELVPLADGAVIAAGMTQSPDFPVSASAYDKHLEGSQDGFVLKISPTGTSLIYSTYLGGATYDSVTALAVNSLGYIYVAGYTQSSNFPTTPGAYDRTFSGPGDAFLAMFVWPQPPLGVTLERVINRSLFRKEAFHTIKWNVNSLNAPLNIDKHRVYRKEAGADDTTYALLKEVSGTTYECRDDYLDVNKQYVYFVVAVDSSGLESAASASVGN